MVLYDRQLLNEKYANLVTEKEIHLHYNQIEELEKDIFQGLPKLEVVHLHYNKIQQLDRYTFSNLHSLTKIYLGRNQIKKLDKSIFQGLVNLTHIDLYKNEIKQLDKYIFRGLNKLTEISLARNKIENIDKDLFHGLVNLSRIILFKNEINKLEKDTFAGLAKLEKIKLHNNQFKEEYLELNLEPSVVFVSFKYVTEWWNPSNDIDFVKISNFKNQFQQPVPEKKNFLKKIFDLEWPKKIKSAGERYKETGICLGEGTFGVVFKMESIQEPKKYYAVKKLKDKIDSKFRQAFLKSYEFRETKLLHELPDCDYVVKYIDCFFDDSDFFYLVLDFCEGGNLADQIRDKIKSNKKFSYEIITQWSEEMNLGAEFLHAHNIIHRDIKPANLLLKNNHIKLGDLGGSINYENSLVKTFTGTPAYMSPEMIRFETEAVTITPKTDIWSIGIVIFELLTFKFPFNITLIKRAILNDPVPDLPQNIPEHFKLLIKMMLHKDVIMRADSSEIKQIFESLKIVSRFQNQAIKWN